ncbi:hypothetical protein NKH77_56005 [Streptomyces sp. M19]
MGLRARQPRGTVDDDGGPSTGPRAPHCSRAAQRAYTAAVAKVNTELAGTEGWAPLPERMEQLRRGVAAPETYVVPSWPEAEVAAGLMDRLEAAGRRLAALPDARSAATTGRAARTRPGASCARHGGSASSTGYSSTPSPGS